MKSKLRKVHIGDVEWSYVIDATELRIYEPKTKQIKVRVNTSELEKEDSDFYGYGLIGGDCYLPSSVKKYINDNLLS